MCCLLNGTFTTHHCNFLMSIHIFYVVLERGPSSGVSCSFVSNVLLLLFISSSREPEKCCCDADSNYLIKRECVCLQPASLCVFVSLFVCLFGWLVE